MAVRLMRLLGDGPSDHNAFTRASLSVVVPREKLVQHAMHYGREQDTGNENDNQARVERVEAREELAARSTQRIHRPHSAKNHRRVEEGVSPCLLYTSDAADDL